MWTATPFVASIIEYLLSHFSLPLPTFPVLYEPDSSCDLTVMKIIERIEANQDTFQRKYAKKIAAEDEYYKKRYKLNGTKTST